MTVEIVTHENLAEFTAEKLGLNPDPAPTEAAEEAEPVVENDQAEPAETDDEATEQDEHKPVNHKVDKRFSVITKQRESALQEAAREREARVVAETKLRELEAKLPPVKEEVLVKPDINQYSDVTQYADDLEKWSADNALRTRDRQDKERQQVAEREKVLNTWKERQAAIQEEQPDYDEVISASSVRVSDQVQAAILESDIGPKILYHIAKNPEIADALASKSVASALREIGRLEALLSGEKTTVKPVPKRAPEPITPIKASRSVDSPFDSSGEFTGTLAEYKALRASGKIK